jgi:hypothetical protein
MRSTLFLILFSLPVIIYAQNVTISGRVTDQETGEPLEFASVWLKGKPIGTITNLQGEFDFHMPVEYRNEILIVSMLGYKSFEAPVWTVLESASHNIQLSKSATMLEEIVVHDSLTGGDILQIAISRIDENFPQLPFLLEGFYRDVKKVGATYISLLEAAVKIYDEGYNEPRNKFRLRERVRLIEVRKSLGYENKFTKYFDQDNLLEELLLNNNIRYRQIDAVDSLFAASIEREADSYYDGHEIYVVAHKHDYSLKVFIDKNDYSIIHLEYETKPTDEVIDRRKNLVSKFGGIKKNLDFRKYKGKMFLNYITMTSREHWYDQTTGKLEFETELFQQLLINNINAMPDEKIGTTEKMRNYGLQYQDLPYNKKFWDDYNVIKETPLDKQILADLEKMAPLEKQFEN